MKTRMMKWMGGLVMIVTLMSLTSCEVDIRPVYDDYHNEHVYEKTRALCSRTWEETWTMNGNRYTQRLDFYDNRTGRDFMRIVHWDGYVTEDVYYFDWSWDNSMLTSVRMVYGPSDVSYLDNIWIQNNTLTGYLDDVEVRFKGR